MNLHTTHDDVVCCCFFYDCLEAIEAVVVYTSILIVDGIGEKDYMHFHFLFTPK